MVRARGNARKRKSRLTSETLATVVEVARPRPTVVETPSEEVDALATVEFDILELFRDEPDSVVVPAAYNESSSFFTEATQFSTGHFVLGLMVCSECRNEMIYYQQRQLLAEGYTFRCRVCQHQLHATLT